MRPAEYSSFEPVYRTHSPHHRQFLPPKGILRNTHRPEVDIPDIDMTRPPNSGVQGSRRPSAANTPIVNTHQTPQAPPENPQQQPLYHYPSLYQAAQTPVFPLSDGGFFTPTYIVPGTLTRATPTGPLSTPAVFPGLLPASSFPITPYPLPYVTPTIPTFPMHASAPATPFPVPQPVPQPYATRPTGHWRTIEVCHPLAVSARGPSTLEWDLWRLPSSALRRTERGNIYRLSDADLRSPVTVPPTDSITISCRMGAIADFWPDIEVRGTPVTVDNILEAIYRHFHTAMDEMEYREIVEMDRQNAGLLVQTMTERCELANKLFENAWMVGLRRVDCLGDSHFFKGLQVEYSSNDSWKLELQLDSAI
ncbi:hypothetical protein QCA50_003859 [Cerrena zonata]|uniref:DUF6699 domain-containing protein n=1 Tax=Cerrena zonata TaxID=2478898 RepID=A0AAW0GK93_9APHY